MPPRTRVLPPKRASRGRALVSVTALIGGVLLLPVLLPPADTQKYYLALLLTALTLLPIVARAAAGTLDAFEPIISISALIGLSYGIRAMYIAYEPVTIEPIIRGRLPFYDYIDRGLILAIAAYCSLLVGYFIVGAIVRVKPLAEWRLARTPWASRLDGRKIAVLITLGTVSTAVYRTQLNEEVTGATTLLGTLANMVQISTCVVALYLSAGDTRLWLRVVAWGITLPLAAWQSVAFASKTSFLQFLYIVVAARHYAKRRVGIVYLALAAVLAVLLVFPIVGMLRGAAVTGERPELGRGAGIRGQVSEVAAQFSRMSPAVYVQYAAEGLLSRATGIDTLSLLLKYDMSEELGDPASYAYIPAYAFIPRVVWPDKPVLDQATRFGRLLLIATFEGAQSNTAFGITHIGDLLVSFGIPGVLIGMCVVGCFYRLTYKFFDPQHTPDLGIKFLYVTILWSMVNGFEGDIPSTYANLLKSVAVWWALKLWLNERHPVDSAARRSPSIAFRQHASPQTRIAAPRAG